MTPVKCSRCGKEMSKPLYRKIYYRTREWRRGRFGRQEYKAVVKERRMAFCSKECSSDEQMSREG